MKFTPAVRTGLSVSIATGLYGISFGALSVASGLTVAQTQCLSALMFTGGSQFAYVGAVGAGGWPAFLSATLMGVRNMVYGAHMNQLLKPRGLAKLGMAQVTIDESFATSTAQSDPAEQRRGFWTAGVGVWVMWNLFTLVGALVGNALGNPGTYGLDGAAVAAFIALLWPRLKSRDTWGLAVLSAVVTVICVPLLPPGFPLLVAAAIIAALTLFRTRGMTREQVTP